ncbi:MAG: nicotinate-nucleotide diphosphorylase (carboxylating), partial [Desulfomonilia bacterium]|nr:nicotinate-nucleotide diphosphorylase (carboxylating) [Desulfomonilia bacterium]
MDTTALIDQIIDRAFEEDGQDITSMALFSGDDCMDAVLWAKDPGIIAGLDVIRKVFQRLDEGILCSFSITD